MRDDFQVGEWQVFSARGVITAEGKTIQLEPRVMDLLVYLAEHSDEVLSKERLIQAVWPDTFVADDVLTSAVWKLRQALGDDPKNPAYIQTLPRRGYHLIAEVLFPEEDDSVQTDRYRLDRKLGEGGMGEVYLAQDTELGRQLALKFLKPEEEADETQRRRLRREAKAAALLDHPFICKIYDTGKLDGRDFIAMEYIEGEKLSHRLRKGPLSVKQALQIALEMTEALEVAHRHGIVHRDIKPANVILTDQEHVKITDFGIAKKIHFEDSVEIDWTKTSKGESTSGTPAYMSPEQIRQEPVDHRTDLFLLGIVFYEMLTGIHPFRKRTQAETSAAILKENAPPLSEYIEHESLPLIEETVLKLLEKKPEDRYQLAQHLRVRIKGIIDQTASLESPVPSEDVSPYPGLSSFSSEQSQYFFGREMEIEAIWKKLHRSHLLGLIGPSGSGKSSFLRAGVVPAAPDDWSIMIATPGNRPFLNLAQALFEKLSGDAEAFKQLLRFEEPEVAVSSVSNWRSQYHEVLIVVDQFEELFTLNPKQTQGNFINLLGRLVNESGIHLLLAMRDDFLFHCHGFTSLEPIFAADLTPIGPPKGFALKQALVQPAEKCGIRFEDKSLVEEMLGTVEEERSALPLLAFAALQLWERRNKEKKILTHESYELIGGVEGALARHAETTLEKIGTERIPIVRELFRNLITARGTRSVQNRNELLSVFDTDKRKKAARILDILVNDRLLVSFRSSSTETIDEKNHRIEIIHESLLTNWPRLVRWQSQDTEGAQIRDELKQAAQMWEQHDRTNDLLWTGTAFKEFEVWRERYPGGLTDLEVAFGEEMVRYSQIRSRRKKLAVAAILVFALAAILTTTTLWRQSADEALRAEAAHLLAEAQLYTESDPTTAIAYATKSLEMADTEVVRLFVLRVLSHGPIAFTIPTDNDVLDMKFSPDGNFLGGHGHNGHHEVWFSDGSSKRLNAHTDYVGTIGFSSDSRYMVSQDGDWDSNQQKKIIVWKLPELEQVNEFKIDKGTISRIHPRGIVAFSRFEGNPKEQVRLIPFEGSIVEELGQWPTPGKAWRFFHFDSDRVQNVNIFDRDQGSELYIMSGLPDQVSQPRKFAETKGEWWKAGFLPDGNRFITFDLSKEFNIWSTDSAHTSPMSTFQGPEEPKRIGNNLDFDKKTKWLSINSGLGQTSVWDLTKPVSFGPLLLRHGETATFSVAVHPEGQWVAVGDSTTVSFWPLSENYPSVLLRHDNILQGVAFDPEGSWAAVSTYDGKLFLLSLESDGNGRSKLLLDNEVCLQRLSVSPDGERIAVTSWTGSIFIVPVSGGPVQELTGFKSGHGAITFDQSGIRLAAAAGYMKPSDQAIRIWDLDTGDVQVWDPEDSFILSLRFEGEDQLYTASQKSGLRLWNLEEKTSELLVANRRGELSPNGRYYLSLLRTGVESNRELMIHDLEQGNSWALPSHGNQISLAKWHPNGEMIISSSPGGEIRVSTLHDENTHILFGTKDRIEIDSLGRWIASFGPDGILRFFPMPDLSKPQSHTLPYDELMSRLKSMTNYRVVDDESSSTGYKIQYDQFPGWEKVPEW